MSLMVVKRTAVLQTLMRTSGPNVLPTTTVMPTDTVMWSLKPKPIVVLVAVLEAAKMVVNVMLRRASVSETNHVVRTMIVTLLSIAKTGPVQMAAASTMQILVRGTKRAFRGLVMRGLEHAYDKLFVVQMTMLAH